MSILLAYLVKTRTHPPESPRLDRCRTGGGVVAGGRRGAHVRHPRLTFEAQEIIGGTLSILAVGLVTWMIFWMATNARHLKGELHSKMDKAAGLGWERWWSWRFWPWPAEGIETALFLWAAVRSTGSGTTRCWVPCSASRPRWRWAT